jgi:hypothetical protein
LASLNVYPYRTHVRAALDLLLDANPRGIGARFQPFRFFDHYDRVGPRWHWRSGRNIGYRAGFDGEVGQGAGAYLTHQGIVAGAIGGDDRESILRGSGKRGKRFLGGNISSEDSTPNHRKRTVYRRQLPGLGEGNFQGIFD